MKRPVIIALAAVLLIGIAGILYGLTLFFKKHADLTNSKPDYVITATALQKEFEENEATATAKYVNKVLEVTGNIVSITLADSNTFNISLKTGSDISAVICTFSGGDPSKFKQGDEITLRGECSGYLLDVLLNYCALKRKP